MSLPHASILFRPHNALPVPAGGCQSQLMVEAPGTAPGSALLISHYIYRHSQHADPPTI